MNMKYKEFFLKKKRIWISSELTLGKMSFSPGMTIKSIPRGKQVSPSFRQVIKEITQSHRASGDLVFLTP